MRIRLRDTIGIAWKYGKYPVIGLAGAGILLLIWGVAIEPRLIDYNEETGVVPDLPDAWKGKRIALIADIQIGMWLGNEDTVRRIVARIIDERPAAVLIAGDLVYHPTDEKELDEVERDDLSGFIDEANAAAALLQPLVQADIPTYAVLGNHDYGMDYPDSVKNERLAVAVQKTLKSVGIRVLNNEAVPLRLPAGLGTQSDPAIESRALYLVGIGSLYASNNKTEVALGQVPADAPRIVLMHEPDTFPDLPANAAPLAFAGHTHGGQVRIPFTEDWSWMSLLAEKEIHGEGWIDGHGQTGNRLYVNRGIGFSNLPIRINCRPELTMITLQSEN